MVDRDGSGLGVASVDEGHCLHLLSWWAGGGACSDDDDGGAGRWTKHRVIELDKDLLPIASPSPSIKLHIAGFAEGVLDSSSSAQVMVVFSLLSPSPAAAGSY